MGKIPDRSVAVSGHFTEWWNALVHPENAARLVIYPQKKQGFERFLIIITIIFYGGYGLSMGLFRGAFPALISGMKMPFLYLFTVLVCFPMFYALNCLIGPGLRAGQCIRLILIAVSANALAIGSWTPFSFFFTITTSKEGYSFIAGMHYVVLALSGIVSVVVIGLSFRATAVSIGKRLRPVFVLAWACVYGFVGIQMGWVLRPMVGTWNQPYEPFRKLSEPLLVYLWKIIFLFE